jgi:hypothetical protein
VIVGLKSIVVEPEPGSPDCSDYSREVNRPIRSIAIFKLSMLVA